MTKQSIESKDVKIKGSKPYKSTKDVKSIESRCKLCNKTHDSKPINKKEFVKVANRVNDVESRFDKEFNIALIGDDLMSETGPLNDEIKAFISRELKANDKKWRARIKGMQKKYPNDVSNIKIAGVAGYNQALEDIKALVEDKV